MRVLYSAVVIDDNSKVLLKNHFSKLIPKNWEVIMDHMTINMGELEPDMKKLLGEEVTLYVYDFSIDDKVAAVGVSGFYSKNKKPHITLAVNREAGGKPVMSNNLTKWVTVRPLTIKGYVSEITG